MAEAAVMAKTGWKPWEFFSSGAAADLGVPVAVLAIVMALITPLPPFLLDLLLVIDIMMSVIVMMVAMYITRPVGFQRFSHHPAVAHVVPPGSERLFGAPDPA